MQSWGDLHVYRRVLGNLNQLLSWQNATKPVPRWFLVPRLHEPANDATFSALNTFLSPINMLILYDSVFLDLVDVGVGAVKNFLCADYIRKENTLRAVSKLLWPSRPHLIAHHLRVNKTIDFHLLYWHNRLVSVSPRSFWVCLSSVLISFSTFDNLPALYEILNLQVAIFICYWEFFDDWTLAGNCEPYIDSDLPYQLSRKLIMQWFPNCLSHMIPLTTRFSSLAFGGNFSYPGYSKE